MKMRRAGARAVCAIALCGITAFIGQRAWRWGRWEPRASSEPSAPTGAASAPQLLAETSTTVEEPMFLERLPVPVRVELLRGEIPEADRDRGDATLRIRLVSDRSGVPVAMDVRVWRLAAPRNSAWTEGDEIRGVLRVPTEGAVIAGVPPGRYRVECREKRHGAEDPSEFVIADGRNDVDVPVAERRWMRARLCVVDHAGAPVRELLQYEDGSSIATAYEAVPEWACIRRPIDPDAESAVMNDWGFGTACGVGDRTRGTKILAGSGVFDLGRVLERGTDGYKLRSLFFTAEGRNNIRLQLRDDLPGDSAFVAVAVPISVLVAGVETIDGDHVDLGGASIRCGCTALRHDWEFAPESWKNAVVDVCLEVDGYDEVQYTWSAATASERRRILRRSAR